MATFCATFLPKLIYYIFTEISSFKTWFVAGILRFQKWFDVDVLYFLVLNIMAAFALETVWATFRKFW